MTNQEKKMFNTCYDDVYFSKVGETLNTTNYTHLLHIFYHHYEWLLAVKTERIEGSNKVSEFHWDGARHALNELKKQGYNSDFITAMNAELMEI